VREHGTAASAVAEQRFLETGQTGNRSTKAMWTLIIAAIRELESNSRHES
jgi:hypothetical protein